MFKTREYGFNMRSMYLEIKLPKTPLTCQFTWTSSTHPLLDFHLDDQFGRTHHQLISPSNQLGKRNGSPRTSQINIWCQTPPYRSLAPISQGSSGRRWIDSGLDMAPAWPAFTNGAAVQPHGVLVESSKQCNTSLKHALNKDSKEDLSPFIQQIKRQLLG